MTVFDWFELLSYVVTVIALPFAIVVFVYEMRRERANEEEEIYQRLSDEYASFLRLALEHADLHLLRRTSSPAVPLTTEQEERKWILFGILISLFERAYLLVYEEKMSKQTRRLWQSWEDYIREWCRREDFRAVLPEILPGEDEDFRAYIERVAAEEAGSAIKRL